MFEPSQFRLVNRYILEICRARGNRTHVKGFGDLYSTAELWPFILHVLRMIV